MNWKEHWSVIRSQQRQKTGTADSNKEQLKDKPRQGKERQLKKQTVYEMSCRRDKSGGATLINVPLTFKEGKG